MLGGTIMAHPAHPLESRSESKPVLQLVQDKAIEVPKIDLSPLAGNHPTYRNEPIKDRRKRQVQFLISTALQNTSANNAKSELDVWLESSYPNTATAYNENLIDRDEVFEIYERYEEDDQAFRAGKYLIELLQRIEKEEVVTQNEERVALVNISLLLMDQYEHHQQRTTEEM
jgi:hypothetical protein